MGDAEQPHAESACGGVRVASKLTIVALSSPPGPASRGVIRASGPDAAALLRATLRFPRAGGDAVERLTALLAGRGLTRARFDDGGGTQPVLVLWMPGPHSYTREDVFELHLPGAPPLLDAALARLLALGARRAERGEFTRRAFVHGRLDLTRAEGVLELVSATTEAEARAATELLRGGLATRVDAIRDALEDLRALAEASLDFDESDTGHVPTAELLQALDHARARLSEALGWEVRRQPPTSLPRVVLVGRPNAGKSTLFNALVGEPRALVSDQAGTTRDWIAGIWELAGAPVLLLDTAGEDARAQGVESQAQAFSARVAGSADLLLHVVECGDERDDAELSRPFGAEGAARVVVRSKADLLRPDAGAPAGNPAAVPVAAAEGAGLEQLAAAVARALGLADPGSEDLESTSPGPGARAQGGLGRELFARHRAALTEALDAIERAHAALASGAPLDLVSEALREGTDALDAIQGRTSPEDLLDRIFARFCLGK